MDNKKNEAISKNYQELIEIMKQKYGDSHGLFEIHQGRKAEYSNPKILLLGRENRGQGNKLKDNSGYEKPVVGDLGWLESSYKFTESPFWRVIGKYLHRKLGFKYDFQIYENIYWTNLYKVSPASKKANTKKSRKMQRSTCVDILKNEILLTKPDYVIAFTGDWINAFKDSFQNQSIKQSNEACNTYNCNLQGHNFKLLALPHPQGKKEEPIIKFILENTSIN